MVQWGRPLPVEVAHSRPTVPELPVPKDAPWVTPPPGAVAFQAEERTTVTGQGASAVTVSIAPLEIPPHLVVVIRELTYAINDVTISTRVSFRLRLNAAEVVGYTKDVFPRVASHVLMEFDPPTTIIRLPSGPARVDVLVRVEPGDIGTYLVGAFYRGWFYDADLDRVYSTYAA